MTDGYVKYASVALFDAANTDFGTRIVDHHEGNGSTRVFTNYTFYYSSAGSDVYAYVNGDHTLIADSGELAEVLTLAEAVTDGMIIPSE